MTLAERQHRNRRAVELYAKHGLNRRQIAERLGMTLANVTYVLQMAKVCTPGHTRHEYSGVARGGRVIRS